MMTILETSRLQLRTWHQEDYPYLLRFFSNEKTARFVGGVKNQEASWRLLATYIGHFQLKGFSYLAVETKGSKQFVGSVGLWKSEPWPELELGYWFLAEYQGRGYATEAAMALRDFAFEKLNSDTLVSYIHPQNLPSIKLAKRLGGMEERMIELLDFGPHVVYRYSP